MPAKQEMWVQSLGQEDLLEKAMATHFNILACKMCGQRSLEGYSPWGGKRVRQDLATKQQTTYTNHCPNYFPGTICFRPPKKAFRI